MGNSPRLGQADWIKAAFRALTRTGMDGVRVDALASALGVTKGSFYWHFSGVPDLKAKMLDHWAQVATDDAIGRLEALGLPLADLLIALLADVLPKTSADDGGPMAEISIRQWARADRAVAERVAAIDRRRLTFLTAEFVRAGFAAREASSRASLFYAALLGAEMQGVAGASVRPDPQGLVELLTRPSHPSSA
ncbi:MAG: TetR/AcrR family transcriptional regulator [Parvularcula sp.]